MNFSSRVKQLREEKGLTHSQVAAILGKSEGAVRSWEMDRSTPDINNLIKLAEYFNCSTDYLLGRTNAKKPENEVLVDTLGLSDRAIGAIQLCNERSWLIEEFISDTYFKSLIHNYTAYRHIEDFDLLDNKLGITFADSLTREQREILIRAEINDMIDRMLKGK